MSTIKLLVTDLDNTVYNWIDSYVPSFLAMIEKLHDATGIAEEELKASFKRLHEKYHTSEYTFAIQELDVLQEKHKGLTTQQIVDKYDNAIRAFRETRKNTLRLYDGVREALTALRLQGKKIAARTDALMFHAAVIRLRLLQVEDLFDAIFAPPDHGFPPSTSPSDVRFYDDVKRYETSIPIKVEVDPAVIKPNPKALLVVLDRFGVRPDEAVYVGDSLFRDVIMAQRCGVHDVHAEYGQRYDRRHYAELLKITYWAAEDVRKEERAISDIKPTFVISCFPELLSVMNTIEVCG